MSISLLIPTRGRPESMERFARSVDATAINPESVEIVFGIDAEDSDSFTKAKELSRFLKITVQAKELKPWYEGGINLSSYWNQCYAAASYDILGFFGDDVIFSTTGWDLSVGEALAKDPTIMISCNGVHHPEISLWGNGGAVGYLFFTHRRVHELFGYYMHEALKRHCMDTVLEFIYKNANRFRYRADIITEHFLVCAFPDRIDETHIRMSKWCAEGHELFQSKTIQDEIIRCSDLLNAYVLKCKTRKGTNILQQLPRRKTVK